MRLPRYRWPVDLARLLAYPRSPALDWAALLAVGQVIVSPRLRAARHGPFTDEEVFGDCAKVVVGGSCLRANGVGSRTHADSEHAAERRCSHLPITRAVTIRSDAKRLPLRIRDRRSGYGIAGVAGLANRPVS